MKHSHAWFALGLLTACSKVPTNSSLALSNDAPVQVAQPTVTEGQVRPRRRHENDMDFAKYNPFYWQGRQAHFKVEDFTAAGQKKIRFTLTTEWPQNYIPTRGPDFSAIYIGNPSAPDETMRSKFQINKRMDHIADFKVFQAELGEGEFNAFADKLQPGAILTFEFRFFLDESNPDWQAQKKQDPHNLSAYYSEFFRIRIGESGLTIDDPYTPNQAPSALRLAGGATTIPTVRVEPWKALQQQALNLTQANSQNFMTGRTWFHTDFATGEHVRDPSDDKPSVFFDTMREERSAYAADAFNANSCSVCHANNGTSLLPEAGEPIDRYVVKTVDRLKGEAHASFGGQLQTQGASAEGQLKVSYFAQSNVSLGDGTSITLRKPVFTIDTYLDKTNLGLSPRRPQAIVGLGLLEAVPEATIKSLAKSSGGQYKTINGKIGRYGWKADKISIVDQIGAALRNDMGVSSKNFVTLDCGGSCVKGKGDLPDEALTMMETYVSLLGVPPRMTPEDETVKKGEAIFQTLKCQTCHVQTLKTGDSKFPELANQTIQPYTDLLLHDMGPDLADDTGLGDAKLWRTAPLWALKDVKHSTDDHLSDFAPGNIDILWTDTHKLADQNKLHLLHDGRAQTLAEAILWHGGEASAAVKAYKALSKDQRDALEAFIWDL